MADEIQTLRTQEIQDSKGEFLYSLKPAGFAGEPPFFARAEEKGLFRPEPEGFWSSIFGKDGLYEPQKWTLTVFDNAQVGAAAPYTEEISQTAFEGWVELVRDEAGPEVILLADYARQLQLNERKEEILSDGQEISSEESAQIEAEAEAEAARAYEEVLKAEADRVAEEQPDKIRLAQQCMLTGLLKRVSEKNNYLDYNDKMLHLDTNIDPDLLVNQLTKRPNELEFSNICPEILAELVPYVRIYKTVRKPTESVAEMVFENAVREEELIFEGRPNRGKGVGLKSIDWTFDGSDPYTSSRSIQVNLNFFFQNFEELNRPRIDPAGHSYRYLDLILMADCRDREDPDKFEQRPEDPPQQDPRGIYTREFYPECHEIKLVLGWAAPEGASYVKTLPNAEQVLNGIEASKTTLWLTLVDHNFNINQDGTFNLQANYMGRMVGLTSDPRANVFIDPGQEGLNLMNRINNLKAKISEINCDSEALAAAKKEVGLAMKSQRRKLVSGILKEMYKKNYIATISMPHTEYFRVINALNGGRYLSFAVVDDIPFTVAKTPSDTQQAGIDRAVAGMEGQSPNAPSARVVREENVLPAWLTRDVEATFEAVTNNLTYDTALKGLYQDFEQDSVTFSYFYLGDLIEIITERVLKPEVWAFSNSNAWRGVEFDKAVSKIRVVLGTLMYSFGPTADFKTINISDIPISLALFTDWMKDNVIDSEREEYPFMSFINDVMTNLIAAALGSNCFEGLLTQRIKVRKTYFSSADNDGQEPFLASGGRISRSPLNERHELAKQEIADLEAQIDEIPENDIITPIDLRRQKQGLEETLSIEENEIRTFELDGDAAQRPKRTYYSPTAVASKLRMGETTSTDHYHYIMFYMENTATRSNFTGNRAKDEANGIYHMQLGRECGLLKNASFRKTNQQFLREARFSQQTSEDYNPLAQLSNVYDVEFTMIGNNIWIPGKRIYFDPTSISAEPYSPGNNSYGLGRPDRPGDPAQMLGLGGYHIVTGVKSYIESGRFETVVTARWETGGGEIARRLNAVDNELVKAKCEEDE
tara:strand:- start:1127 stop:4264 length:3138 start_codon:yes stop_codon:yes gene_type:complete